MNLYELYTIDLNEALDTFRVKRLSKKINDSIKQLIKRVDDVEKQEDENKSKKGSKK